MFLDVENKANNCKGKIYRCVVNNYVNNKGSYITKTSMNLLQKKSCKGCEYCGWFEDIIDEYVNSSGEIFIEKPTNNSLYKLTAIDCGRDWETGLPDGFDLEFRLYKEEINVQNNTRN